MPRQYVIKTQDPELLERTLNGLPMVNASVDDDFDGEKVSVLILSNADFAEYAIREQGYGEIVSSKEV